MSTNSRIGYLKEDGETCVSVYCHWDGYPEWVGRILSESYTDLDKIKALIAEGDISSLDREIGERHDFVSRKEGWTTFYRRDRKETEVNSQTAVSFRHFVEQADLCGAQYAYVFYNGEWFVTEVRRNVELLPVTQVLAEEVV